MKKYPDIFLMAVLMAAVIMFSFSPSKKIDNNTRKNISTFLIPDSLFHSGDIIFRDGRGFISSAFRKLSLIDPRYSHAGIIHEEAGKKFVYHVIGGEGKTNKMRKDLLSDFCSQLFSNAYGVYRSDLNGKKIDDMATAYYLKETEFDNAFNLATDEKMYCTELVFKILTKVSGKNNFLPLTTLSGMSYEACDNIYLSPHMKKIYTSDQSISL